MVESDSGYAEELAKLQRQEHEAKEAAEKFGFEFTKDIEELLRQETIEARRNMDSVGSISLPADSVPVPAGSVPVSLSAGHTNTAGNDSLSAGESVSAAPSSTPSVDSLGFNESPTRYPSPIDLGNSLSSSFELEGIHHHPSTGIFTSSSYDDDFSPTLHNLAPTVEVNPLVTKRVNNIHPQSLILGVPLQLFRQEIR